MGARMPQHFQGIGIFIGKNLKRGFFLGGKLTLKIHNDTINLGGNRGLGQPFPNGFSNIPGSGSQGNLPGGTIWQFQGNHGHSLMD